MSTAFELFRIEIRENVAALARLNYVKIILVAALLAVAFGISGFGSGATFLQSFSYWVLLLVPFVCVYIDLQYYHGLAKIFVLAHFLSNRDFTDPEACIIQEYERFISQIREEAAPRLFSFESKAQRGSTVFLSLLCPIVCGVPLALANIDDSHGLIQNLHVSGLLILPLCGYIGTVYARKQYDDYVRELEQARHVFPSSTNTSNRNTSLPKPIMNADLYYCVNGSASVFRLNLARKGTITDISDSLLDAECCKMKWRSLSEDASQDDKSASEFSVESGTDSISVANGGNKIFSLSWLILSNGAVTTKVVVPKSESVYGFGAGNPAARRDNTAVRLANSDTLFHTVPGASYSSFPFALMKCAAGYLGILWNTSRVAQANTRLRNEVATIKMKSLAGDSLPVEIFILSGTIEQVMASLIELTGSPSMPPVWALGLHQSRWSYMNNAAVRKVASGFLEHGIPCDAIHFDIHHMDGNRVFTWDRRRFPKPSQLHSDLRNSGIRTVVIVDPGVKVEPGYQVYDTGAASGFFMRRRSGDVFKGRVWAGASVFPDFSESDVRDWWSSYVQSELNQGASGIWNDMNEPVLRIGQSDDGIDTDIEQSGGPHWAIRNLYANHQAQATYAGFLDATTERPFILSRAATSGIQKFAFIWTGDNTTSWKDLRMSLNMAINLGLSGVPFSGSDVGGFANAIEFPKFLPLFFTRYLSILKTIKLRKNPELFCRWIQLGAMLPYFRIHTARFSHAQEPWSFGRKITSVVRKHIRRRYALLPYIYSQAWNAVNSGMPVVRPMFLDYPELPDAEDQFMLGPSLLVAPILERGAKSRSVSIPKGTWFDFETGRRHNVDEAHEKIIFPATIDSYPLLVKSGTILPIAEVARNAYETLNGNITLEFYPDDEADFSDQMLVLDDGVSRFQGDPPCLFMHVSRDSPDSLNLIVEKSGVIEHLNRTLTLRIPALIRCKVSIADVELGGHSTCETEAYRSTKFIEYLLPEETWINGISINIHLTGG